MTQQINLFARLPREKDKKYVVSTRLLRNVALAIFGVFGALFLLQAMSLTVSSYSLTSLKSEQKILEENLAVLEAQYPEEAKQLLLQKGERIQEELNTKTELLKILKDELDEIIGFSVPLEALAKQITNGVWLTNIEINNKTATYSFKGKAFQVDQVLAFIENLGKDEFFGSKDFKVFEVEQISGETGTISFVLATE